MTEETPFRSVFTKKSNFLTQSFVTDPVNIQYGASGKFLIPRHGDFITRLYLLVDYESSQSTDVNQAHAMLEYVEIVIGGVTIQRETGETLNMRLNLDTVEQQRFGITQLYRMLGGGPNYPFTDTGQYPRPYRIAIPVEFWFHGKTELALPLAALRLQEVEINVGFRNADRWGGVDSAVKGSDVRLQIEYGYVNDEVRKAIVKRTYLFPVEQFQFQQAPIYSGEKTIQFPPRVVEENTGSSFVNPVKALFAFFQSVDTETDTVFDYSRGFKLTELTNADGNDYLKSMEVELDNEILLPAEVGTPEFLRGFQYYAHFPGSTQRIESAFERYFSSIYALALCKDPMNRTKLNGGINFTAIKRPLITLDSKGNGGNLKTIKIVSKGEKKTFLLPYTEGGSPVPDTVDLEVGQYVRGLNIVNDSVISIIAPSGQVFYGKSGSSNVTLSTNILSYYCIPTARATLGALSTSISAVYQGSGAKATVNYAPLGSTDMSIAPSESFPVVGDHISIQGAEYDRVVTNVYGSEVINGTVLDKDTNNRLFFEGSIPTVGMYTSDNAIVQTSQNNIEVKFGQVNDILGSTPFPTNTTSFELTDLLSKPYIINILKTKTVIKSDNLSPGTTIDRIEGTTVFLKGYFIDINPLVNTSITISVSWVSLNQNSILVSGSAFKFYPRVSFNSASSVAYTGEAVFGNKITLENNLTADVGSADTLALPNSVILNKTIVNTIQFTRNLYFYSNSNIIAKLYALSVNFIYIEKGILKLVYDQSELTLPRFR